MEKTERVTQKKKILELYGEGKSVAQIAAILGKSYSNVWNVVHRDQKAAAGIEPEKRKKTVCCTKEVMEKCVYGNMNGVPSCDYISITGHRRECDPECCTEFLEK